MHRTTTRKHQERTLRRSFGQRCPTPLGVLLDMEEQEQFEHTTPRLELLARANAAGRQDLIRRASRRTLVRLVDKSAGPPAEVVDDAWTDLERLLDAAGVP